MLDYEQRVHFSVHGWVLIEDVFTLDRCAAYIEALQAVARTRRPLNYFDDWHGVTSIDNLILYDDIFVEWFEAPGILDANRQLLGAVPRLEISMAHIRVPDDRRAERGEALMDPDTWEWHRGMRPKWAIFPDDAESDLINCLVLNNITCLTAVSPGNGATAILDGSHRLEGTYETLKDQCELVLPSANPGDVLIMGEATVHSGVPIMSDQTRYNMYYEFVPPWFGTHPSYDVPPQIIERFADETLRELLTHPHYRDTGQYPASLHGHTQPPLPA